MEAEKQTKQEFPDVVHMDTPPHPLTNPPNPNPKHLSPLVRQEFPLPKPGVKKIPRYTITQFPLNPGAGTSLTLPAGNGFSRAYLHGTSDDTNLYSDFPKNMLGRRSSLPQSILRANSGGSGSDSLLYKLAENCQSLSPELHPPSYTAIKQALLCDKYKRRQSMQTDPKTLKNLLQTKLIISDRSEEDLVNLRRKSDPGSYMKQRDFERRKELFLDENMTWSKSYGRVIDHQIQRWQRKRQQRLQRDLFSWQKAELASGSVLNPLKLGMINPLMAAQVGMVNPLQVSGNPTSALFPTFLNTANSGGVVNPYILPQGVLAGSGAAAATNTPIYYPFGTQYTLVSPYSSLQIGQSPQSATYLVPQAPPLASSQPNVYYYVPGPPTTTAATSASATNPATPPISAPSLTTMVMAGGGQLTNNSLGSNEVSASSLGIGAASYAVAPPPPPAIHTAQAPSPPGHSSHPVSPTNRKRHQSVPEKLTSLLQPPLLFSSSGRISPMETNPDSPPSSKKQRSTSDTALYNTPFGIPQRSPGAQSHSPHRHSASPQPGPAVGGQGISLEGLSALQTHLLQVHQSYGMNKTALEERQRRKNWGSREKGVGSGQGHSPRRKHSGGVGKSGSNSPSSVLSSDGADVEQREPGGQLLGVVGAEVSRNSAPDREGRRLDANEIKKETIRTENGEHNK